MHVVFNTFDNGMNLTIFFASPMGVIISFTSSAVRERNSLPSMKFSKQYYNLIKNSQAVKKGAAPIKAMVKKDVKSKVAAKKWL